MIESFVSKQFCRSSLGTISMHFLLRSKNYVSNRLINDIDRKAIILKEHGFYKFYTSFASFLRKVYGKMESKYDEDNDVRQAVNIQQMFYGITACICVLVMASIIFAIEMIVHKMKMRRLRRHPAQIS